MPYALAVISRVDEKYRLLSADVRRSLQQRLDSIIQILEKRQLSQGGWNSSWAGVSDSRYLAGDDLLNRIMVTGHHLEWIAFAPKSSQLSKNMIRDAVKALRKDVTELQKRGRRLFKVEFPLCHAARALALLRGDDPFLVFKKNWDAKRFTRERLVVLGSEI